MYGKLYFRIPFTLIVNLDSKFYISFLMYFVKSSEQSLFFLNIYNERPFPHVLWNDRENNENTVKIWVFFYIYGQTFTVTWGSFNYVWRQLQGEINYAWSANREHYKEKIDTVHLEGIKTYKANAVVTNTYWFSYNMSLSNTILENVITDQETIFKNNSHKIENFFSNLRKLQHILICILEWTTWFCITLEFNDLYQNNTNNKLSLENWRVDFGIDWLRVQFDPENARKETFQMIAVFDSCCSLYAKSIS